MKNILNELPTLALNNRMQQDVDFVDDKDINNKTILDIGCGFGWCELNFLNRGAKKIIGTELTKKDLKAATSALKDKKIEFTVGSAIDLPFKDETFDTVVSWEVIEHIPPHTEEKMFQEVYRVLKKGGTFYLSTPFDHFLSKVLDPAWWLIGHRHYSVEKLKMFATHNKFKMTDYVIRGRIWSLLALLNMYFSKWIFRSKPFFNSFFLSQETKEYKYEGYANIFVRYIKK